MRGQDTDKTRQTLGDTTCHGCVHYFVTWDPRFPRGCRALSFKTKKVPCHEVRANSGMPCQLATPRRTTARIASGGWTA
ncbi:uracil-DNA glycosylase [bacterium]|nr:uracil-DNA glycosylase [bacterium]